MGLSKDGVSALHFTLALAVALLFSSSSSTFAQHSGGGGSSGGGSSSGGGGGSHGGSSGGSVSSGGGHSSGGGSSSHAGSTSSHSGTSHANTHSSTSHSNTANSNHAPSKGTPGTAQTSQKRGFFSFLRHHVPKPEPKPEPTPKPTEMVAKARPPLCLRGPCPVCPAGHFHGGSGCEGTDLHDRIRHVCRGGEYWSAGVCLQQPWYQDECGGLRTMMERQAKRVREADQDRQISCVLGPRQQCSDFTSSAESEAGFYQQLQNRYQACQRRLPTGPRYNGFRVPGYSAGLSFDSLGTGLGHR